MWIALTAIAVLVIAGVIYQRIGAGRDARRFPPLGRLIDVRGRRCHVNVAGSGSPTVVLEAGIAASSLSWSLVQPAVARFTSVVSYDRAGLGWSDPAPEPRTAATSAAELRDVLSASGVAGPYVLVGHSFGGLVVLEFAQAHPSEVAGLVLVDPIWRGEWSPLSAKQARMLRYGALFSRWGALLARVGFVRLNLAMLESGGRRVPQLAARMSAGPAIAVVERVIGEVRKLPREVWPFVRAHWCQPKSFESMAQHLAALAESVDRFDSTHTLGDLPLIIMSGGHLSDAARSEHERDAALSSRGRHMIARGSAHWVQLDEPGLVVEAIESVVRIARGEDSVEKPFL